MNTAIGQNVHRREAWDKVTGQAVYTGDLPVTGTLAARLLTSPHAHARILQMDTSRAQEAKGVKAVITGRDCPLLFGALLYDRPALATDTVRYAGEPVAMVVAVDEPSAEAALRLIRVEYEILPFVLTPTQALAAGAPILHPNLGVYKKQMADILPEPGTNIASRFRMRKGDVAAGFSQSEVIVEQRFFLPPSDHLAMEVRTARAEITAEGTVIITTSSQAPYSVRSQIASVFRIPSGRIQVKVPLVGGGFGGKAPVTLEILAYIATSMVRGKPVRLTIPREQDMTAAPCRIGMEAHIRLGAGRDGLIRACEMTYWLDCGAYTDIAPYMTKATAVDGTGPYHIQNLASDALCVYTNHTYATSYRSFSHESYTFCIERALDMLAHRCGMDPWELRRKNAIRAGSTTPSQVPYSPGLVGDLAKCLDRIKTLSGWDGGVPVTIKPHTVRVKGIACLWKTENPPTDAISGALITFNPDGSLNLNTGVVEMGSAGQTHLAQMLAEKLKVNVSQVHVSLPVDTRLNPEHWKTVASLTEYMVGHAVVRAADDILAQLRANGSQALGCSPEEIEIDSGRVYARNNPTVFIPFSDIVQGYKAPDGSSVGEPVLGRGGYMLKGLSLLDPQTGRGKTGPAWTVGAQVVEVEVDISTFTYRILNAYTVIDVGNVINPEIMKGSIAGGMAMGLSMASREAFVYDPQGVMHTPTLRTYKLLHIGQEARYKVDFVETPEEDSPYGIRSFSEHGIIGMPAALGNALSSALGFEICRTPLTPETLWRLSCGEEK